MSFWGPHPRSLLLYTRYQAHPPLVRGQVLRPVSTAEFTEICEMLLAEPQPHRCPYWLPKGRAESSNRPADVIDDWWRIFYPACTGP